MKLFLIFLFLFPTITFAQDALMISEEELNPGSEDVLIKRPEKYLRNEAMIYNFNTDLGIKDQRKYTGTDRNRLSLAGHVSGDYEHVNELLGVELTYMRRSTSFDQVWYGAQFFQHRTIFDAITQNHTDGDDTNSEFNFQRPNDAKNTIMALGLGAGYRFKLLLEFFNTEEVFESVDVFVNYINLDETFIGQKYTGYGLTTNYGIHKRSSTSFFYGGKFSYNLASVSREALGEEKKKERSLTLGWLSVAFEMGIFF